MTYSPYNDMPPHAQPRKKPRRTLVIIVIIILAIAVIGIAWRLLEGAHLKKETNNNAIPSVVVMKAPRGPLTEDVVLPGNVQAWHEAPIYARTSGYLKSWVTDIGAHVKEGDLIAEIEAPEVDAQLRQSEADLATSQANEKLAQRTATRWSNALKSNSVAKQDADEKVSAAQSGAAGVQSAQANVERLQELKSFKRITAPFDGVITARNTDTGALINAGSSTGTSSELFHIADTSKLRVYVQVPQMYIRAVKPDLEAELHFAEHPNQVFPAKLAHSAEALDPTSRTLLIQLQVDNEDGALLPGGYTEVHIKLPAAEDTVRLPVNTLVFRAEGMQVAVVGQDNKVQLKLIQIGRDYGKEVEVKSGIAADEQVIVNPPDSLVTGQEVRIVTPEAKDQKAQDAKDTGKKDKKDDEKKDEGKSEKKDDQPNDGRPEKN